MVEKNRDVQNRFLFLFQAISADLFHDFLGGEFIQLNH